LWLPALLIPQPRAAQLDMNRSSIVNLRTMSYNNKHGVGMDDVLDLDRIADVIAKADPDIVGLQEVDKHYSARSNWEDQGKYLAEKLDMHYAYGVNLNYAPVSQSPEMAHRQYGTAILSKYPIEAYENVHLDSEKEQRGLLRATIQVEGVQVHFYTTHLGLTPEERTLQVQQVMQLVSQKKEPSIIVGDFNAWSLSKAMKPILSEYWDAFAKKSFANTSNSKIPYQRIDYILAKADRVQFSSQKVLRTKASDHLPIVANITLTVHNASTPNASGN
ncbi:MAG: endonuclease/exonuclease/phosphatase, partial [Paenibacillus sp.]|nr:endonuclease/exonuclease/phosphatase [Paenibacillus sp.]